MSQADLAGRAVPVAPRHPGPHPGPRPGPRPALRPGARQASPRGVMALFGSELSITFRRTRTIALLGILAALPVLLGVVVKVETGGARGEGPAFIAQVTQNGLFLVFTSLAVTLPVFLPMAVGVVAGDSVAGEASAGTLRYLLVAPAGRTRLLAAKFAAALAFCAAATLTVALAALATGAALFPLGRVTLLSGDSVSLGQALLRAAAIGLAVVVSLAGLVAVGLFVSTLTSSGIAAMATTVGLVITTQILDGIPQLHAIQPWFFPHYWLSFADLLREPVYLHDIWRNAGLQGLYVAVFGSAAWARFSVRDITA
jgi:ABC-2 type transport system permease protein